MFIEEYATSLTFLPDFVGKYLAPGSKETLFERANQLRSQRRKGPFEWYFSLPRESPLTFKENSDRLQADVTGSVTGKGDEVKDVRTLLRVWSLDKALCYRPGIDAEEIGNKFAQTGRRVMTRFHFDPRVTSATQREPIYHLQVGGLSLEDENCWFPKQLKVPRLCFPPMDVILLCELVLVNLFYWDSTDLRKKPDWKRLVMKSQNIFQRSYFEKFHTYVDSTTDTILGSLIS